MTAAAGRDPDGMKICSLFYPISAETKDEAEDKAAEYEKLPNEMDQLLLLSEALNFDFAARGSTSHLQMKRSPGIQGMQTMRDRVVVEEASESHAARFHAGDRTRLAPQCLGRRPERDR